MMPQVFVVPRRVTSLLLGASASLMLVTWAHADVKLPALISDHMVLQAGEPAPIWGWAQPGEPVTVEIAGQKLATRAGEDGRWQVNLAPLNAGARLTLKVSGHNQMVVHDVLAGEVWLGSGQSNMELPVHRANNLAAEKAAADHPELRMFTVVRHTSPTPLDDCQGKWQVCNSNTVAYFSAVLYFFGRDLQQSLHVPMGLIHSSWGGTPIQSWMALPVIQAYPGYEAYLKRKKEEVAAWPARKKQLEEQIQQWEKTAAKAQVEHRPVPDKPWNPGPPDSGQYMPANLYNAMIHPLIHYRIRGAVWYQGESNAGGGRGGAVDYTDLQRRLIAGWRQDWNQGDFPFLYVQLPNWGNEGDRTHESWAWFREGQAAVLNVPNTGMAVTIDIGEADNIHPQNKQEAGRRLALIALNRVYQKNVVCAGPQFAGATPDGRRMKINFTHAEGGLVCHGGALQGFELAGADQQWHPATATIAGDAVVVSSPQVTQPAVARYDWANNPDGNLYSAAGLPASPFRTDVN
jgi:sialate O-acetylesterase